MVEMESGLLSIFLLSVTVCWGALSTAFSSLVKDPLCTVSYLSAASVAVTGLTWLLGAPFSVNSVSLSWLSHFCSVLDEFEQAYNVFLST